MNGWITWTARLCLDLPIRDQSNQRSEEGYADNLTQANTAINCLDAPLKPQPATTPTLDDFVAASPLFGRLTAGFAAQCDVWPIEPTVEAPDYSAPGAAPILVVGTTADPATPYASAVKLAGLLDSGVLLTGEGKGLSRPPGRRRAPPIARCAPRTGPWPTTS